MNAEGRRRVVEAHGRALRVMTLSVNEEWEAAGAELGTCEDPADLLATATIFAFVFSTFVQSTAATYALLGQDPPMDGPQLWATLAPAVQEPPPGDWPWLNAVPARPWWRKAFGRG